MTQPANTFVTFLGFKVNKEKITLFKKNSFPTVMALIFFAALMIGVPYAALHVPEKGIGNFIGGVLIVGLFFLCSAIMGKFLHKIDPKKV
jgi:hypothetical protein